MRPIPIEVDMAQLLGHGRRIVMSAPNGDLTDPDIAPLEVLVQDQSDGTINCLSVWRLEGDDLEVLATGGVVVLSVIGGQPPVGLSVVAPPA